MNSLDDWALLLCKIRKKMFRLTKFLDNGFVSENIEINQGVTGLD